MSSPTPHTTRPDPVPTVLVVEDEPSLADSIQYSLEREGFQVQIAADGERAISRFREGRPSLVLLDLMLPKLSGLDVCRIIRQESTIPIVILTAKDGEADKVAGLELGADDYVDQAVLHAGADLPRPGAPAPGGDGARRRRRSSCCSGGPVELDLARHEARVRGEEVRLTPKEFELLEVFLERKGRLLTRDFLITEVWGPNYFGDTKTLDVHVKRLRQKMEENPHNPVHLLTVRGLGYRFVDAAS